MTYLTAVVCALLGGAGFYFSTGLGSIWELAWLAPIPVLWLAFRQERPWTVFVAAFAAYAIGGGNILPAYLGTLPATTLVIAVAGPALCFAVSVMAARFVAARLTPLAGVLAFAALWTAFDFLASLGANGASLSPAYSQVGMPLLIQGASVLGLWIVTFLIGLFAAAVASALAKKRALPALLAVLVVALNAGYGAWRIAEAPKSQPLRVGLAADDDLIVTGLRNDETSALTVTEAYAGAARTLAEKGAGLIVFPEKVAVLSPGWQGTVRADLITAAHIGHATLVVGFDERGAERRNVARIFFGNGAPPQTYSKRHLVPGLERAFVPGTASFMLADGTAVAICKDMDFPDMLRRDALLAPTLYAVPAWDFGKDRWGHARIAVMRGVENGFSVVRAANDGLLTVSDAYGRVLAEKPSDAGGMVTLIAQVPRGPGHTLYARVGDTFAWICLALSVLLIGIGFAAPGRKVL